MVLEVFIIVCLRSFFIFSGIFVLFFGRRLFVFRGGVVVVATSRQRQQGAPPLFAVEAEQAFKLHKSENQGIVKGLSAPVQYKQQNQ